jgi:hypothetical protein
LPACGEEAAGISIQAQMESAAAWKAQLHGRHRPEIAPSTAHLNVLSLVACMQRHVCGIASSPYMLGAERHQAPPPSLQGLGNANLVVDEGAVGKGD